MVEKSIVLDTIKKMYASGLSDAVITSTLKDIGLGEREIKETIAEAKGASPAPASKQPAEDALEEELHEKIAETTAQKVRQHIEEKSAEDSLAHTTTQAAIAGYETRLTEMTERLASIERKLNSISSLPISDFSMKAVAIDKKISSMESDLSEIKAISNALKSILEKVLDTDRSVLAELEEKK